MGREETTINCLKVIGKGNKRKKNCQGSKYHRDHVLSVWSGSGSFSFILVGVKPHTHILVGVKPHMHAHTLSIYLFHTHISCNVHLPNNAHPPAYCLLGYLSSLPLPLLSIMACTSISCDNMLIQTKSTPIWLTTDIGPIH